MYTDVDDMFPDTDSYLSPPTYMGNCIGDMDNEVMEEIEFMGYDINDEDFLMSGPFKRLFKRIQKKIRARRDKRAKDQAMREIGTGKEELPKYALQTPQGAYGIGPQGPTYVPSMQQQPVAIQQTAGLMEMFKNNPMMLAIPLGLLAILMLKD